MAARIIIAAVTVLLLVPGAGAQEKADRSCDCNNLESLQQETENADYLVQAFEKLVEQLQFIESQTGQGWNVHNRAGQAYLDAQTNSIPTGMPHPTVKDNTSPGAVEMKWGTCQQNAADLERLRAGSPCKEVADIVLEHEAQHRALCEQMGANVYWGTRLFSEMAQEELERYRQQAKEMREQLKRVIDEGTLTIEGETEMRLSSQYLSATYAARLEVGTMEGKSSPGSDNWTLNGKSTGSTRIVTAVLMGESCSTSGQFNDAVDTELTTDGLSLLVVDQSSRGVSGQIKITCKKSTGMSMRPSNEAGTAELMRNVRFRQETVEVGDISKFTQMAGMAGSGVSISGTYTATIKLMCTGQ